MSQKRKGVHFKEYNNIERNNDFWNGSLIQPKPWLFLEATGCRTVKDTLCRKPYFHDSFLLHV